MRPSDINQNHVEHFPMFEDNIGAVDGIGGSSPQNGRKGKKVEIDHFPAPDEALVASVCVEGGIDLNKAFGLGGASPKV